MIINIRFVHKKREVKAIVYAREALYADTGLFKA